MSQTTEKKGATSVMDAVIRKEFKTYLSILKSGSLEDVLRGIAAFLVKTGLFRRVAFGYADGRMCAAVKGADANANNTELLTAIRQQGVKGGFQAYFDGEKLYVQPLSKGAKVELDANTTTMLGRYLKGNTLQFVAYHPVATEDGVTLAGLLLEFDGIPPTDDPWFARIVELLEYGIPAIDRCRLREEQPIADAIEGDVLDLTELLTILPSPTAEGVVTKLTAFLGAQFREWQFLVANPEGDVITSTKKLAGPRDPLRQSVRQLVPALHTLNASECPSLMLGGRNGTEYNLVADESCETQEVPDGCVKLVQTFMLERQAPCFAVARLTAADGTYGYLVAFAARVVENDSLVPNLATIVARTKPALEAAVVKSEAPVSKEPGRHRGKIVGLLILAALVIVGFWPVDYEMGSAAGEMKPVWRQEARAQTVLNNVRPSVGEVHVKYQQRVKKGDLLVTLKCPELESEILKIKLDLQKKIDMIQKINDTLIADRGELNYSTRADKMAEMKQLAAERDGLLGQLKVREGELTGLKIVADMDGTIEHPYEPEKLVGKHPEPGEPIIAVADLNGPWEVELWLDPLEGGQVDIGHQKKAGSPMTVRYGLESDLNYACRGQVRTIGGGAEVKPGDKSGIARRRMVVDLDKDTQPAIPRYGLQVHGYANVGRTNLAWSWIWKPYYKVREAVRF